MATVPFSIVSNHVVGNSAVTGNGKFTIYQSPTFANSGSYDSIMLNIVFQSLKPDPPVSPGYSLLATIESSDSENPPKWFPIAAMFEPVRRLQQGPRHVLVVQPNIYNFFEGAPVDYYDGQSVTTRISRQQGILGDNYRVILHIVETKYGTSDAFEEVTLDIYGQRYNHT